MSAKSTAILRDVFNWRLTVGLLAVLGVGVLLTWWVVESARRELCASQLQQARLVARSMNLERLKALTDTEADTNSPVYLRFKEQFAAVRSATLQCRFVSLLGQRADGALFTFVDSEPADSKDCFPAGQVYVEAPKGFLRVFGTRNALSEGPYTDHRGKWISALVPIIDPQSVMESVATPEDAKKMVGKAVEFYRQNGRERFLKAVNNPQGEFHKGDLYVFVFDRSMTYLALPVNPERVGQNWIDKKDWAGGKYVRREIQEIARGKGHGWVEYEYENFASKQLDHKTTYVEGVDDLIICAGAYRGDGKMLAALRMDVDADDWNWKLAQAALPPAMLTLALVAIALIGSTLLARRSQIPATTLWLHRHLEPAMVAATGLALSLFVGWLVQQRGIQDRNEAFTQLAASQSEEIAETLRELRHTGLESLAYLYERSATVSAKEFGMFTPYLPKNPAVQALEWIPVVLAADKPRFEATARADGLPGFDIWQKDAEGKRIPATERTMYYPILHLAPLTGNKSVVGYDLGSEPLRRAALETAMNTGLPTATDPVTLVQERDGQKGMLVFRPVFDPNDPKQLRGFAVIALRMGSVLRSAAPNNSVLMEVALQRKDGTSEPLANSWQADRPPITGLSLTRPVLTFGKVYSVTAYAGMEFMRLHPMWDGWMAGLTGLVTTASLAVLIGVLHRRREQLEWLVSDRTSELRESENRLQQSYDELEERVETRTQELRHANEELQTEIDNREQAEDAFRRTHERLDAILESISDAFFALDDQFVVVYYNRAAERMLRRSHTEVLGRHFLDAFPEARGSIFERNYRQALATREFMAFESHFDVEPLVNWYDVRVHPFSDGIAVFFQVTTERKRAQAEKEKLELQNRQLQKAESLGRMAGAIAHHFNNQLQAVMMNLEMAINDLPRNAEPVGNLTEAKQSALKAAEVSTLMLTYLGQTVAKHEPLYLCEACQRQLPMLEAGLPKDMVLETDFPTPGPVIHANTNQIQQVLMNLVTNAWEALGGAKGSIRVAVKTICASEISAENRFPVNWQSQGAECACLEVTDAGCGIAAEDIEMLFDPFFSTKFTGRGLGLPVVLGIVRAHSGCVTVESQPGKGSVFRVFLPLSAEAVAIKPAPLAQAPRTVTGGTVLVVDDEPCLRKSVAIVLRRSGFAVFEAMDGVEAVEVFQQHRDEIGCVLCDLTMPRMNGWETLTALRKLAPGLPVILCSGYSEAQAMAGDHPELPQAFLCKPFELAALKDTIARVMGNR